MGDFVAQRYGTPSYSTSNDRRSPEDAPHRRSGRTNKNGNTKIKTSCLTVITMLY